MAISHFRLAFFVSLFALLSSAHKAEIKELPGVDFELNFRHYSGFFKVSSNHFLHYWFVESQNDPANDPVIFWFNGGPGCSSLDGLLNEMGPYVANKDGKTLRKNEFAWNKLANVIYIEAPAGVGFSYASDGNTATNDDQTSLENYEAVKLFYQEFPQFRNHSTFIMGESYGGVYVPTLTARIVEGQKEFPINLKGMALGNGYVNGKMNIDTALRFAYGHGLVDEQLWETLETDCCGDNIETCDFSEVSGYCANMVEGIFRFLWSGGLNPYDLYRDCDPNPDMNSFKLQSVLRGVAAKHNSTSHVLRSPRKAHIKLPLMGGAPCLDDSHVAAYLNNPKVRHALHVPFNLPHWEICSDVITHTYQKQYSDMKPFVRQIADADVRVLLFYGDTDMACNFLMGQKFAAGLGYRGLLLKSPWTYGRQIAGFKTLYERVTFLTIRGAGHMAPQWRAPEMFHVVKQFLRDQDI